MTKSKVGLGRGIKLKKNLRVLRWNWKMEVVLKRSNLLVPNVARTILVSVYWVPTGSLYCGKEGQKVRDCPMIASRGREGSQVSPSVPKENASINSCFYALQSIREKPDESDDNFGKFCFLCVVIWVPSKWGSMVCK